MRRHWGTLFLGIIAGALVVHLHHARQLEELYREKERLKVKLFETTERLTRSEALWADRPGQKICSVELSIKGEPDEFVKLELQRRLGELTAGLIGTSIEKLEPDLAAALLHRRKLSIEGKDYLVAVNWIAIAPHTLFNLSVSPAPGEG